MVGNIYLLDCTLRDGGYINNWNFGRDAIRGIKGGLEEAGVDIIELGFLRVCDVDLDRSVYATGEDVSRITENKKAGILYSAMIEAGEKDRLYPVQNLGYPEESGLDYIRVCLWKRLMREHLTYCREIVKRGYRVSIQPTAVCQYGMDEFVELLKLSNDVRPYAVYVVDTWGTCSSSKIIRYFELADRYLDPSIKIGYHGHNNKMQALSCAEAVLKMGLHHDVCLDASIMGMGRGIGNLNLEVIMEYLNQHYGKKYDYIEIIQLYQRYLKPFYEQSPWGYSMYHFLSALYRCSPDYASYFRLKGYSEIQFQAFLKSLKAEEKSVFDGEFVENRLKAIRGDEGKVERVT